jgi:hypothetical protein
MVMVDLNAGIEYGEIHTLDSNTVDSFYLKLLENKYAP